MFIPNNFTPVGASARSGAVTPVVGVPGNAPSIYKYTSVDLLSEIIAPGYFNFLKGVPKIGDWIFIDSDIDGTLGHSIHVVGRDGTELSGVGSAVVNAGGSGYAVGDYVNVTFVDGTLLTETLLRVTAETAGVVDTLEVTDPGTFSVNPATLTALSTVNFTGSGTGLTVDVVLETDFGDIFLIPRAITAT